MISGRMLSSRRKNMLYARKMSCIAPRANIDVIDLRPETSYKDFVFSKKINCVRVAKAVPKTSARWTAA